MALFVRHRSYTEKVRAARNRRRAFGKIFVIFLLLGLFRTFFLQTYRVDSDSMEPALARGETILSFSLPLGAYTLFGKLPPLDVPRRGELIVAAPRAFFDESWGFRAWDSLARFFTLQRYSPMARRYGEDTASPAVYRVIGLPGDRVRSKGALYELRPRGSTLFSSEYVLSKVAYKLSGTETSSAAGSSENLFAELSLGEGEYFVACDNRSLLAGSRLWGPIGLDRIIGRVTAVFWPPRSMRTP